MKQVAVLRLMVELPDTKDLSRFDNALAQTTRATKANMRVFGFHVLGTEWGYGSPTKEEAMRLVPKKIHFGKLGWSMCDREMPVSRLTEDWKKVTCKFCKKKRPQLDPQRELF